MPLQHRRAFRHAVEIRCQVVRERDFRVIADRVIDLSTDGMRVPTEARVLTGERLIVSFLAPRSKLWIDAEATVARVVHGRRPGERGRSLGLAFHGLSRDTRHALFQGLRALPPASPRGDRDHARR
jgi:hypothetical protein